MASSAVRLTSTDPHVVTLEELVGFELDAADPEIGGGVWLGHRCGWEVYLAGHNERNLANLIDGPVRNHLADRCRGVR